MDICHFPEIFALINQNQDLYAMIKHCPLEILNHWEIKDYPAGSIVCRQGKQYDYFFIIIQGSTEIYYMAKNGRKYSQVFNKAGECIGEFEAFEKKPYICFVEAFTDLKLIQLRRDLFVKWLELDRNFNIYITRYLCNRFYSFAAKAGEDTLYSLKARLCNHLLLYSRQTTKKTTEIEIEVNKEELSDRFAVTSRSVNRILQYLKMKNIIAIKETAIIVKDLNRLADEVRDSQYE
jgi:CRP-like cAMP-binding protein